MDKKRTRGRQKIKIQKITNEADRFATFSKRRLGLYKKASEISTLCDVDIGVMVFSPTGKPFSFFHPTMECVMNQFLDPHLQFRDVSRHSETFIRTRISHLNQTYDEVREQLAAEKKREKQLALNRAGHSKHWWDMPVADMNKGQVEALLIMLKKLKMQLKNREEEMKTHASTSSFFLGQYNQNPPTLSKGLHPLPIATRVNLLPFETMSVFHASHGYYPASSSKEKVVAKNKMETLHGSAVDLKFREPVKNLFPW